MARIVCDVPPHYPESEDQEYAMSALEAACGEASVEYSVLSDKDGLPKGYVGLVAEVDRDQLDRILELIARDHDEANLADCYALLDCEFDTGGMFRHQRMLFYEIEEE
jgi:hypothetical protein